MSEDNEKDALARFFSEVSQVFERHNIGRKFMLVPEESLRGKQRWDKTLAEREAGSIGAEVIAERFLEARSQGLSICGFDPVTGQFIFC